jgi:hypothetical protein
LRKNESVKDQQKPADDKADPESEPTAKDP